MVALFLNGEKMESSKRILVCGGGGYIGSHLVRSLCEQGWEPVVFDNFSSGHVEAIRGENATIVRGDLNDPQSLRRVFAEYSFNGVFHFAAFISVGESVVHPVMYYQNNVGGTLNLLGAMKEAGVKKLVFSSTAAVYGEPREELLSETHPCNPVNPYGRSKLMVEKILEDCAHAYGLDSVALRYFNAAGAHPDGQIGEAHPVETHLIPLCIRAALGQGKELKIFGDDYPTPDGTCIRDYIHVCDLADAHIAAMRFMEHHPGKYAFNLGNGNGFSVREVISSVEKAAGRPVPHSIAPRRSGDPARLVADSALARWVLNWNPRFPDLDTIVSHAWAWHARGGFGS